MDGNTVRGGKFIERTGTVAVAECSASGVCKGGGDADLASGCPSADAVVDGSKPVAAGSGDDIDAGCGVGMGTGTLTEGMVGAVWLKGATTWATIGVVATAVGTAAGGAATTCVRVDALGGREPLMPNPAPREADEGREPVEVATTFTGGASTAVVAGVAVAEEFK